MSYAPEAAKDYTLNMTPAERNALLLLIDNKANKSGAAEMWSMLRVQLLSTVEADLAA